MTQPSPENQRLATVLECSRAPRAEDPVIACADGPAFAKHDAYSGCGRKENEQNWPLLGVQAENELFEGLNRQLIEQSQDALCKVLEVHGVTGLDSGSPGAHAG